MQRLSVIFNQICLNKEMQHKYTHSYIYIYIYISYIWLVSHDYVFRIFIYKTYRSIRIYIKKTHIQSKYVCNAKEKNSMYIYCGGINVFDMYFPTSSDSARVYLWRYQRIFLYIIKTKKQGIKKKHKIKRYKIKKKNIDIQPLAYWGCQQVWLQINLQKYFEILLELKGMWNIPSK